MVDGLARRAAASVGGPLLSIGGNDPTGGAGIQADIKTFQVHGAHGMAVVTGLIAGNTVRLDGYHGLPAEFVTAQLAAILSDLPPVALKTGLLGSADVVEAVADALAGLDGPAVVVDPVLVAKNGQPIVDDATRLAIVRRLLPLALVATPNSREAAALTGLPVRNVAEQRAAALALRDLGPRWVLVKGRELAGADDPVMDLLAGPGGHMVMLVAERVQTGNYRGTGCTLSAAITARLGRREPVHVAVGHARDWVVSLLAASRGRRLGAGVGPLDHGAVRPPA